MTATAVATLTVEWRADRHPTISALDEEFPLSDYSKRCK